MKARKIVLFKFPQIDPFTKEVLKDQDGKEVNFSYRQQLWLFLRSSNPNESFSTDEMMKRAQVQFLLEQARDNEELFLEEAQYEVLKQAIENIRWTGATQVIADMVDHIRNAEEVELEPKKQEVDKETESVA